MSEKSKKPKIVYFSWYELNHPHEDLAMSSRSRIDCVDIPNYISLWAKKIKEVDPDGKKGREIANKYAKK